MMYSWDEARIIECTVLASPKCNGSHLKQWLYLGLICLQDIIPIVFCLTHVRSQNLDE